MTKKIITISLIIVSLITIFLISILLLQKKPIKEKEMSNKYSKEVEKYLINNNISTEPYSKLIEALVMESKFNIKYKDEYLKIKYIDKNNYLDEVNLLLDNGYKQDDINKIFEKHFDYVSILIKKPMIDIKYLDIKNFRIENLDRYIAYEAKKKYDLSMIVTYVNIGIDKDFYENISLVEDPHNINVLVNKYNKLPENFEPEEVVTLSGSMKINAIAKEPVTTMVESAKKAGYKLCYYSGYRPYSRQVTLYNGYAKRFGQSGADTISARPGHTEHSTGLAVDFCTSPGVKVKETDGVYEWFSNNAHLYGFILRFPKDKTFITGYVFEPWHYRYLGIELATKVKESGLTYEEYYDLYIKTEEI